MPILYKPIKAQNGTATSYIFKDMEELKAANPGLTKILKKNPGSNITRCVGAAHDASAICGIDYRKLVSAGYDDKTMHLLGENDAIVDAWNWKDAANNTDEVDVIWDRERDGEDKLEEILSNLPLHAFIGTGDARGVYIDKNNKRRSRHGIVNLGYLEDGTPIIYDLTKFKKGIPDKYKGKINYIAVPKDGANITFGSLTGTQIPQSSVTPETNDALVLPETKTVTSTTYVDPTFKGFDFKPMEYAGLIALLKNKR